MCLLPTWPGVHYIDYIVRARPRSLGTSPREKSGTMLGDEQIVKILMGYTFFQN